MSDSTATVACLSDSNPYLPHGSRYIKQIITLRIKHKRITFTFWVLHDLDSTYLMISPPTTSSLPSPQLTKPNHTSLFLFYQYSKLFSLTNFIWTPDILEKSMSLRMAGSSFGLRAQLKGQTNSMGLSWSSSSHPQQALSPPISIMFMVLTIFSQLLVFIYWLTFLLFLSPNQKVNSVKIWSFLKLVHHCILMPKRELST